MNYWPQIRNLIGSVLALDRFKAGDLVTPETLFCNIDDLSEEDLFEIQRRLNDAFHTEESPLPLIDQTVEVYLSKLQSFFNKLNISDAKVVSILESYDTRRV